MITPKGMIDDSIIALLKEEEVLKKMSECQTQEECYDVVMDKVTVNFDEFIEMMAVANALLEVLDEGVLSEEDLNAVAGGKISVKDCWDDAETAGDYFLVATSAAC